MFPDGVLILEEPKAHIFSIDPSWGWSFFIPNRLCSWIWALGVPKLAEFAVTVPKPLSSHLASWVPWRPVIKARFPVFILIPWGRAAALEFSSLLLTGRKKKNWANWRVTHGTLKIWHLCTSCDSWRILCQNQNFFHDNLGFLNIPVIAGGDFILRWCLLDPVLWLFCSFFRLMRAKSWQVSRELLEIGVVVT